MKRMPKKAEYTLVPIGMRPARRYDRYNSRYVVTVEWYSTFDLIQLYRWNIVITWLSMISEQIQMIWFKKTSRKVTQNFIAQDTNTQTMMIMCGYIISNFAFPGSSSMDDSLEGTLMVFTTYPRQRKGAFNWIL